MTSYVRQGSVTQKNRNKIEIFVDVDAKTRVLAFLNKNVKLYIFLLKNPVVLVLSKGSL